MERKDWQIYLTIVFILLGIFLSAQSQTHTRLLSDLSKQKSSDLVSMAKTLTEKEHALLKEIVSTKTTLDELLLSQTDEQKLTSNLNSEADRLKLLTGEVPIQGSGVSLTIQDDQTVLYQDIIYLVNELWAAGAEAISINQKRFTSFSTISYIYAKDKTYITHNKEVLDFPLRIDAIGDSKTLEKGLTFPGGIIDQLHYLMVDVDITAQENINIPALIQQPKLQYAKPLTKPPIQELNPPLSPSTVQ